MEGSLDYIQRVLPFCRSIGDRWLEFSALRHLGYVRKSLGDFAGAREAVEQTLQFSRVIGYRFWECTDICNLALIHYHLGDAPAALELAEQGLRISQEIGSVRYQGYAWMSRGHALAALRRFPEAREAYQQARRIRVEVRMPHLEMESVAGLAAVALASGDQQEALGYAEEILSHLQRVTLHGAEEPFQIWLTCFQVLRAQNDSRAKWVLETAHRQLQESAKRLRDKQLRHSFLAIPAHRELLAQGRGTQARDGATRQGDGLA
jgi:tetratricopeptide (TPR) repeat protein